MQISGLVAIFKTKQVRLKIFLIFLTYLGSSWTRMTSNDLISMVISGVGMCGTQEPIGSGVPGGTHPNFKNMGSGGVRVPDKLDQSGFRWVPGSRSEPKKWVPGGSRFQVGTQKVGSGFQVGTPKSGFRANWAKLGSVTVLKKEIFKVDDLDNIPTKIRNI